MANSIDLIIGSEAIKQVENLISKLSLADAELIKISQSASVAGKGINGISTPSGLDKSIGSTASLNAELEKQNLIIADLTKKIDALAKKREDENTSAKKTLRALEQETKSRQSLQSQKDKAIAQANKEQAIAEKNANTYNKTQAQINRLTTAYNDLSVRKARYNNLNENEEKRLVTLSAINEKYNGILKQTDATIGKNQRNVGNYASGYNALGNSINQLTREAPAFANSISTGFMAISNNLPTLFDAIKGIRNNLKSAKEEAMSGAIAQGALAKEQALLGGATEEAATALGEQAKNLAISNAEGVKGKGVFKQLGSAIFSWGTLLSVGVTLLTIYGKDLVELAFGMSEAEKAQKLLKDGMNELNNSTSTQTVTLKTLSDIVLDTSKSEKERKIALTSLKTLVPELNNADIDHADTLKNVTYWTNKYIEASINRAKADGLIKLISEEQTKVDTLKNQSTKDRIKWYQQVFIGLSTMVGNKKNALKIVSNSFKEEENALEDNIKDMSEMLQGYIVKADESEKALKGLGGKPKKVDRKDEIEALKGTEKWYEQQIAKLKEVQATTADTTAEYKVFTAQILLLEKALKLLKDGQALARPDIVNNTSEVVDFTINDGKGEKDKTDPNAWIKQYNDDLKDAEKLTADLKKATDDYLSSFSAEFMANSGFSETFRMLNKDIEGFGENFAVTFNAIAESAQEAFNFISNASQQNFDAEYSRLESQKEISLKFAGDSTTAKAKIEADYEKKRKEIANRENKAKQKQAIFNIAIDTAQAIIATLAKTPAPVGLPIAAIVAAMGAVQIGMVASQKIPQYFDGGTHGGGLAMINDAGGSNYVETVVTPDGKVSQYSGRDVVTNLPAGTEIFTPEQWRDKELQYMLNSKGISMQRNTTNNGMTAQEMDIVLSKHFGKIQTNTTIFDKNGIRTWSESNGNKTIQNANRVSRTGLKV